MALKNTDGPLSFSGQDVSAMLGEIRKLRLDVEDTKRKVQNLERDNSDFKRKLTELERKTR